MRAVKDSLDAPLKRGSENLKGFARRPRSEAHHTLTGSVEWMMNRQRRCHRGGPSEGILLRWAMMSFASVVGSVVKGGCMLASYRGAQSLGRRADGKREGGVLLNVPEVFHRIPAPSW